VVPAAVRPGLEAAGRLAGRRGLGQQAGAAGLRRVADVAGVATLRAGDGDRRYRAVAGLAVAGWAHLATGVRPAADRLCTRLPGRLPARGGRRPLGVVPGRRAVARAGAAGTRV